MQACTWGFVGIQHFVSRVRLRVTDARYHDSHIYIIDVSQSVEHDHPKTFEFLRTDIRNVEDFFRRRGDIQTLGPRRTWEFIVSESVGLDPAAELGDEGEPRLAAIVEERRCEDRDETDDAVFMSSFIPRNLGEVYDPERDVDLVNAGRGDELIYSTLAKVATTRAEKDEVVPNEQAATDSDSGESTDGNDKQRPKGFRNEDKDAKKVRFLIMR
jgi:RIO kinase 1